MIAQEEKPGRNDPCPCGSGLKVKKCCGSVLHGENKKLAEEVAAHRALLYILLLNLQKVTRSPRIAISAETLRSLPPDATYHMETSPDETKLCFWVEPPKEKLIGRPSRIILPGRGA
jgi:hypothetical protein